VASLRTLDPRVRPLAQAFIRALEQAGVRVIVTSTRRSLDEQKKLYADYLAGRSKYPAARPGTSTHGVGAAFDLHLEPPVYQQAGELWERLGFTWGGRFQDKIHFDVRPRA
jgi:D-alanyl-D-alanine carboxypeptidase-like protein